MKRLTISLLVFGALVSPPAWAAENNPTPAPAAAPAAPAATPAPPPSAPPKLSAAELEKLLMPIALYADALLATMLPASVYPLEIVQAARFTADTNNISKIDDQAWDPNVKAIAKIPAALKKMNDDLPWTIQLGEAFLNQDKDVMDTIQALRLKAQQAGTLRTTEQQVVIVTNMVVEKTVEQQVVVVTNTIVQVQPANPQVVYVPTYPPTVYYPPPAYVYDPYAPLITFAAGVAVGAIIANNCDWNHGGCYGGGNVNINQNVNINRGGNTINGGNRNQVNPQGGRGQKWQADPSRVRSSGSATSAKTMESRGWGSGGQAGRGSAARPSTGAAGGARPGGATASTRPAGPSAGNRASSPSASTRPSSPGGGAGGNRATASPTTGRQGGGGGPSAGSMDRSGGGSKSFGGGSSAFSGGGGGARQSSARGGASRGGGGGGRGGGGRR